MGGGWGRTFLASSSLPQAHPSFASPLLAAGRATGPSRPGPRRSKQGKRNQGGEGRGAGGSQVGRTGWRAPLDPWPPCSGPSVPGTLGRPHEAGGRHSWAGGVQGGGRGSAEEASWTGRVCKAGSLWGCQQAGGGRWWGGRRGGASRCDMRRRGLPGRKGELRSGGRSPAIRSGKICFLPPSLHSDQMSNFTEWPLLSALLL